MQVLLNPIEVYLKLFCNLIGWSLSFLDLASSSMRRDYWSAAEQSCIANPLNRKQSRLWQIWIRKGKRKEPSLTQIKGGLHKGELVKAKWWNGEEQSCVWNVYFWYSTKIISIITYVTPSPDLHSKSLLRVRSGGNKFWHIIVWR